MLDEFFKYILENIELIKNNLLTFIIGWAICLGLGWAASRFVFTSTNERYKKKYNELSKKYQSLKNIYSRDDVASAVSGIGKKQSPLADEMSKNL